MKIMMLTAGEGTRLRPHTNVLPKPAIPFLNVPLFLHALRFLEELNPTEIIFNTYHLPHKLKETVSRYLTSSKYHFSDESVLLGSGGGIGFARKYFLNEDYFVVMNGDELILPEKTHELVNALDSHKKSGCIATLLVTENSEVGKKFGGVWVNSQNQILGFGKQQIENSLKGYHYIGAAIFSKKIFDFIPEDESNILYDNLMSAFTKGFKAQVFPLQCHWFETGNEVDFKQATWECLELINKKSSQGNFLLETIKRYSPDSYFEGSSQGLFIKNKKSKLDGAILKNFGVFAENIQCHEGITLDKVICGSEMNLSETLSDKLILTSGQGS